MDKLYIVVGSIYHGATYCFECANPHQEDIGQLCETARETVFEVYAQDPENFGVPSHELYKSITIDEVSTVLPTSHWDIYIKD